MLRKKMTFVLDRVPRRCNEGPFWGNGTVGALLYLRGRTLCWALDHVALWETRESLPDEPAAPFAELTEHVDAFKRGDPAYVVNRPKGSEDALIYRTRLPGLRLALDLPAVPTGFHCSTDPLLAVSELVLEFANGRTWKGSAYLDSCEGILRAAFSGDGAEAMPMRVEGWDLGNPRLACLRQWGYAPCTVVEQDDGLQARQPYAGDCCAVLTVRRAVQTGAFEMLATLAAGPVQQADSHASAATALLDAYAVNHARFESEHRASWATFWASCDVCTPVPRLNEAFDLEMYKLFCNARPDGLTVTLQGVWNADDRMPAWTGDLHNDLNVQACYWPAFKTGNARLARPYIETYHAAMPRFMERAKKLFGIDGAVHVPVMMSPDGYATGMEWCFWNVLPGPELFVATDFCWYYEYTQDRQILREKIYPFLKGVATLYQGIVREGKDGLLHIPFTQSPEYGDDSGMLIRDDSTFALSALRYVLEKLAAYAALLGEDAGPWQAIAARLAQPAVGGHGYQVFPGEELRHSHRHFCHMYPIFPLGYDTHNSRSRATLEAAINQGFTEFAAFSMPYLALFGARHGLGNLCRTMLELYCMAFRAPNSFVVNGDPYRNGILRIADTNAGESDDAFTLESGLMVPAALCDMMAHRSGDTLWLLSGVADDWRDCAAEGIAIEGGHRVSVRRAGYAFHSADIRPARTERLSVVLPKGTGPVRIAGAKAAECEVPGDESGCRAYQLQLQQDVTVRIGTFSDALEEASHG